MRKRKKQGIDELTIIRDKVKKSKDYLESGKIEESIKNAEEAEELFDGTLQEKLDILEEYSEVEDKYDSTPLVFLLPVNSLIESKLDLAVSNINSGNVEEARSSINNAQFWVNNATLLSIVIYLVIISSIVGGLFFYKKSIKRHKKTKKKNCQ